MLLLLLLSLWSSTALSSSLLWSLRSWSWLLLLLVLVFVLAFVRHSSTNNWNQPTEEAARRTAHRYGPRNHVCARLHTTSQVEESHEGRLRMIGLGLDAVRSQSSSRSTAYMPTTLGRG